MGGGGRGAVPAKPRWSRKGRIIQNPENSNCETAGVREPWTSTRARDASCWGSRRILHLSEEGVMCASRLQRGMISLKLCAVSRRKAITLLCGLTVRACDVSGLQLRQQGKRERKRRCIVQSNVAPSLGGAPPQKKKNSRSWICPCLHAPGGFIYDSNREDFKRGSDARQLIKRRGGWNFLSAPGRFDFQPQKSGCPG